MKKIMALILAVLCTVGLVACKAGTPSQSDPTAAPGPESSLELLKKVWESYAEADKFPAVGGEMSADSYTENAPGAVSVEDGSQLEYELGFPENFVVKLEDAASLHHMMNVNTFTCGAYGLKDAADSKDVVEAIQANIASRQWMCGFPDELVILTMGRYVVSVFGLQDLVDGFETHFKTVYPDAVTAVKVPIE